MKTKFIEGTNKQYSIREDGAVFIHYKMQRITNTRKDKVIKYYKLTVLKGNCVNININGIRKRISVNTLLFKNFGYKICKICNKASNTVNHDIICKKCSNESKKIRTRKASKKYKKTNPHVILEYNNKRIKDIIPCYIASKLHIKVSQLTETLYKDYKRTLKLKRRICQKHNISIHKLK